MKHILNFNLFEASLREELPTYLADIISQRYDELYLDMEVPEHTNKIPNIKVEINNKKIHEQTVYDILSTLEKNIVSEFYLSDFVNLLKNKNFQDLIKKTLM
jgi:hypothetical protein